MGGAPPVQCRVQPPMRTPDVRPSESAAEPLGAGWPHTLGSVYRMTETVRQG